MIRDIFAYNESDNLKVSHFLNFTDIITKIDNTKVKAFPRWNVMIKTINPLMKIKQTTAYAIIGVSSLV